MPLKKLSKKRQKREDKPWMTAGLKTSRKKKFSLLIKANSSNDPACYKEYKEFLNLYTNMKKESRRKYYRDRAAEYRQNKAKTWMLINEISNRKRKSALSLKCIKNKKGEKLNESLSVANCLNEHFSSVGKRMANEIENEVDTKTLKNPLDYLPKTVKNSLFFTDIDISEILNLMAKLVAKKACGYDHISNRILKATSFIIAPFLCQLYNNCIHKGVFPDAYKIAKVIPLFKKGGDRESLDSYRPISLLPALGKLLEKLISVRVVRFFDAYNLFSPHQFGFRAKFSTDYAIVDIYEKLLSNLDKGLRPFR